MSTTWIVICRADAVDGQKGPYELSTRTVFNDELAARCFTSTISESREPRIIPGDFRSLRFDEARGTAEYWGASP